MIVYKFRPEDRVYDGPVELPDGPAIPKYHTFQAPPEKPGFYAVMGAGWILVEGEKPPPPLPPEPDYASQIRAERDKLLVQTDWTQLADSPVDKEAWATYRQALRDIPQQDGFPTNVVWPAMPE
jgi:hypothetical protein